LFKDRNIKQKVQSKIEDIINIVLSNSDEEKTKDDDNNIEYKLLRQTNEEEKARKRTRGPYRNSSRSIGTTYD
jgi:hypothetical protein